MKFLITGGTGNIGSFLINEILSKGYSINYLTRNQTKIKKTSKFNGFYWDPYKQIIDEKCFDGVTHIVHLSGESISKRWTNKRKKSILSSRLLTTQLLFKSLSKCNSSSKIEHIVCASAIGIYESSFDKIYDEKLICDGKTFLQKVVKKWEKELLNFKKLGIGITIFRIGLVLSKNGGILKTLQIPTKLNIAAPIGNGNQYQSWIHEYDLSNMIMESIFNKWFGVYNAVSPNPVKQKEFIKLYSKTLNKMSLPIPIPKFIIRLIFGEMSVLIFNSQYVSATKISNLGFKFKFSKLNEALSNLVKY
jgi:uncharacterized protein (TIGR01777 family)